MRFKPNDPDENGSLALPTIRLIYNWSFKLKYEKPWLTSSNFKSSSGMAPIPSWRFWMTLAASKGSLDLQKWIFIKNSIKSHCFKTYIFKNFLSSILPFHSLSNSLILSFTLSFSHSFTFSFSLPPSYPLVHSLILPLSHSLSHSLILLFTLSFSHSLILSPALLSFPHTFSSTISKFLFSLFLILC